MRFRNQLNTERQKKRTNRGRVFRGRRRRRRRTIGISSERQPRARAERITEKEQFEGGIVKAEIESDTERKREWERVQEAKAFLFLLS